MTERGLDRERLFEALDALRGARDASGPETGWAWRVVDRWIDARLKRPPREHDDIRQRTLIKVMKGVAGMQADTPPAAEAWLRRVHRSATNEHHRGHDPVTVGLRTERRDDDGRGVLERLAAPEPERNEADRRLVDAAVAAVLERVERWLEQEVRSPTKRLGDRRRAECALMANVLGLEPDEIAARLEVEVSRSALYKWVERGREGVLMPVLEAWAAQQEDDPEGARLAVALGQILRGARRSDAGKPRPGRRSVSRGGRASSPSSKRPKGPGGS